MTRLLCTMLMVAMLSGCQTVVKKEIVTVDKPIPFIPPPPKLPEFVSEVDKLTDADSTSPGKVAQAYKADMVVLRARDRIHSLILSQYANSSSNFDAINQEIAKLFDTINKAEATVVDKLAPQNTPALDK